MAKTCLPVWPMAALDAAGRRRLLLALAASLLLHAALIGLGGHGARPAPPQVLHALLLPPPPAEEPLPAVLHDTLGTGVSLAAVPRLPIAPAPARTATDPGRRVEVPPVEGTLDAPSGPDGPLYPPEAVAAGLQGEVRVRITLDAGGAVADARIARGSGHAVLDAAALRAAYALGRLPGAPAGELVLPVIFRLR